MKIYFSAALVNVDDNSLKKYEKFAQYLIKNDIEIYLPHINTGSPRKKIDPAYVYKRNILAVLESDCVIADVSYPSHGVGIEIAIASQNNIPILYICKRGINLSRMILGNGNVKIIKYTNLEDIKSELLNKINNIFKTRTKKSGLFISIEGIDLTGKSTICSLLKEDLLNKGYSVYLSSDPPDISPWNEFKEFFEKGESINKISESIILLASRIDNFKRKIDKYLKEKYIVISDRYNDSWLAYQSLRLKDEFTNCDVFQTLYQIERIIERSCNFRLPDYTIMILDNPDKIKNRLKTRNYKSKYEHTKIQKAVQDNYLKLLEFFKYRIDTIKAEDKPLEAVHSEIMNKVLNKLELIDQHRILRK